MHQNARPRLIFKTNTPTCTQAGTSAMLCKQCGHWFVKWQLFFPSCPQNRCILYHSNESLELILECALWTFAMRVTVLCLLQHSGRFYEELPNTADYVSYRLACNKDDYPEPYSPPINPPLSFLPQHPYHSQPTTATGSSSTTTSSKNTYSPPSHTTAVFKYPSVQGLSSPPPGVAAYTFPKEQYV